MFIKLLSSTLVILGLVTNSVLAQQASTVRQGEWVASFSEPTDRYGHAVLGDTPEWTRLCLAHNDTEACVTLPKNKVFEDIAPRLADVNADGRMDAVVVESDDQYGASLVVYLLQDFGELTRIANDPIGTRFRWLAPIGIADLDGDGYTEIAYIDRPHLAKTLRILRYVDSKLVEVAATAGLTNHRIGESYITSGLKNCRNSPVDIITADASFKIVMASRFDGQRITTRAIAPLTTLADVQAALECTRVGLLSH